MKHLLEKTREKGSQREKIQQLDACLITLLCSDIDYKQMLFHVCCMALCPFSFLVKGH